MRPASEVIKLGEHEWVLRPLTIAQVREIEPVLMGPVNQTNNLATGIEIISIALKRDHSASVSSLNEVEATAGEISKAMAVVLRLGGFIDEGSSVGEAEAGTEANLPA